MIEMESFLFHFNVTGTITVFMPDAINGGYWWLSRLQLHVIIQLETIVEPADLDLIHNQHWPSNKNVHKDETIHLAEISPFEYAVKILVSVSTYCKMHVMTFKCMLFRSALSVWRPSIVHSGQPIGLTDMRIVLHKRLISLEDLRVGASRKWLPHKMLMV